MEDKVIFDTNIEDAPMVEIPKGVKKANKGTNLEWQKRRLQMRA